MFWFYALQIVIVVFFIPKCDVSTTVPGAANLQLISVNVRFSSEVANIKSRPDDCDKIMS